MERPPDRALPAAVLTGVLALLFLVPLRTYGLNVEDEGTLIYQIVRFARGELPYADFATGYTPGFFALSASLWHAAGDLVAFRTILIGLQAVTAAGLAFLIARLARPTLALILPWLYLGFIPVYPGEFCAVNTPYPAWFATLGWLATASCMLAFVGARRRGWLVAAGVAAALTFAMKPNAGVFAMAAAVTVLLLVKDERRGGGVPGPALWLTLWAGILGGVWIAFGLTRARTELVVFLLPLLGAMAALLTASRIRRTRLLGDVAAVLGPYVLLSAPWILFFVWRLGLEGFLTDVLLLGSNAAALYYVGYPGFEPWALAVTAVAIGFAVGGWFVAQGRLPPAPIATILAVAFAATLAAVPWLGLMPEGIVWSIIWQLQNAAFALTLAAHAAGVVWLWFRGRRATNVAPATIFVFASFMHLQLYPRTDFMHLLMAAPLSLVFAGYLLERAFDAWERGFAARGAARAGRVLSLTTTALLVGCAAIAAVPGQGAVRRAGRVALPFAIAPVGVEEANADDLRDLGAAAQHLGRLVPPGGPSVGFPAIAATLLLTETVNPAAHDYFYPGRPDHREEAEIVDRLVAAPPAALASLNGRFTFFDGAPPYYFLLRRLVRARYRLDGRYGRYDVLRRGDLSATAPGPAVAAPAPVHGFLAGEIAALRALAPLPLTVSARALLEAATGPAVPVRRLALATLLDGLARAPVDGLERWVAEAGLDRRRRILLLRGIRDRRDPLAASYLFVEAASGDPRVARDALGAMYVVRAQMIARRYLWSGPLEPPAWPGREGLLAAVRGTLADAHAPARAVAFAAELSRALHDAGSVPALRDRWRVATRVTAPDGADAVVPPTGPRTAASVAAALTELAPDGLACELIPLLGREQAEIFELIPTLLLQLAEAEPPIGAGARACLRRALAIPGAIRMRAIWIVAALHAPDFDDVLVGVLGDAGIPARRAAAWALGERAPAAALTGALQRAATVDADPIVRRLAVTALEKHAGTRPRAFADADR